ncbi:hypothetical protein WICPIJ_009273 [Wickerhamomyces pijperi]|uniref:Uncharacterized protein n=1 Tax=Wickerhamomyces pijperi TaxID=599730 RepID=A0A9P8PQG9_WICPI|nr:hypothetical protein WICPIJ_009273 [Wickerhamomyces pijperi]
MHVRSQDLGTDQVGNVQLRNIISGDESVVGVDGFTWLFFQFFGDGVQEGGPSWGWAKVGYVVSVHLNTFVGSEEHTSVWQVFDVVDVHGWFHGGVQLPCVVVVNLGDSLIGGQELVLVQVDDLLNVKAVPLILDQSRNRAS